jgi:hypothetical protein
MSELDLFDENPIWRAVLQAYADRKDAESGWVPRIESLPEVDPAGLSPAHGKLIALGLLKFELGDKTSGIRYQVTGLGRHALIPREKRPILNEWQATEDAA